jgi:hypothetical protein
MIRAALALCVIAAPAIAQQTALIGEPALYYGVTSVRIQPTEEPGAVAEIIFDNVEMNNAGDEGGYVVTLDGITVQIAFGFNVAPGGQDSITVTPPAGFIAVPETLTLMEGDTGVVLLYAEGMS